MDCVAALFQRSMENTCLNNMEFQRRGNDSMNRGLRLCVRLCGVFLFCLVGWGFFRIAFTFCLAAAFLVPLLMQCGEKTTLCEVASAG